MLKDWVSKFFCKSFQRKLLATGLLLIVLWIGGLMGSIYAYSFRSDPLPAEAAIVLGAAAWHDQPSPVFEERIKHGIHLYQTQTVEKLIFTGGVGAGDQYAESQVARAYALKRGVPSQDILYETTSKTTLQNLLGAKEILTRSRIGRVLIVSDPLHLKRAVRMARDLEIEAYPSPTPTTRYISAASQIEFLLRETFFYLVYLVFRK